MYDLLMTIQNKISKYSVRYSNRPRRFLLRCIFFYFKQLILSNNYKSEFNDDFINFGIKFNGGVGDHIFNAKYIYALKQEFGDSIRIDILCNTS